MKNILLSLMVVSIALFATGCGLSTIDAGEEGVQIYQPYIFGEGGVDKEPLTAGSAWTVWSTDVVKYNVKPEKRKENFVDLTASDNVAIDFDVYLTIEIQKGATPIIHELSGKEWYSNKIKDTFRAYVRNEARTRTSIELRTNENIITQTQENIKAKMVSYIKEISIPLNVIKINIGKVVPPAEVLAEAAQTAAQKQRKQTQGQRKLAEDARAAAETSSALADKAYADKFKMTTEQFLRNKELDIMSKASEKGAVTLIMNASSALPMYNIK